MLLRTASARRPRRLCSATSPSSGTRSSTSTSPTRCRCGGRRRCRTTRSSLTRTPPDEPLGGRGRRGQHPHAGVRAPSRHGDAGGGAAPALHAAVGAPPLAPLQGGAVSIRRVNHGKGHSYIDTDTGLKIPGVTTITGDGIPKPALLKWSAETTASYAVDHWDELSTKAPSVRLKELYGARYAVKDAAANRGTQVHKLDDFDVQPILVEATVWHPEHGYCGTLDLIADLLDPDDPDQARLRYLLDIKTSRSGVFGEHALQLAGYRHAPVWVDADGTEHDMPTVDATGVVHVRADGYDLVPVEAGEAQFRTFLYAQQIGQFLATSRDLIGEPVVSPTTSTYRLVRDD